MVSPFQWPSEPSQPARAEAIIVTRPSKLARFSILFSFALAMGCGDDTSGTPPEPDAGGADAAEPDGGEVLCDLQCEHGECELVGALATCVCDPGFRGDACGELDAPDPGSIAFWLDAADPAVLTADGDGHVATFRDKGTQSLDCDLPQTTSETPTVVADGLNGLPVVHFDDGEAQYLTWTGSQAFAGGNRYTMFLVFSVAGSGHTILSGEGAESRMELWRKVTTGDPLAYVHAPDSSGMPAENKLPSEIASSFGWEDGQPHLVTIRRNNSHMSMWIDGRHRFDVPTANAVPLDDELEISLGRGLGAYLAGDVAEVMVFGSAMDHTERREVEAYLGAKWFGAAPEQDITSVVSATIWLDASQSESILASSDVVANWHSLGHAGGGFSQSINLDARPVRVSAALGGLDVVRFDGESTMFMNGVDWGGGHLGYGVFAALVPAATGGTLSVLVGHDEGEPGLDLSVLPTAERVQLVHRWPAGPAGGDTTAVNPGSSGEPVLVEALRHDSSNQTLRANGAEQSIFPAQPAINAGTLDFILGAATSPDPTFGFVGDIAELALTTTPVTEQERAAIAELLEAKWGL
jgi:hypothetical protein